MIFILIFIELYTYSEEPEFVWNAEAFKILFQAKCMSDIKFNVILFLFLIRW